MLPVADRDWSVRGGTLAWDGERTITHMIGATASVPRRSTRFISRAHPTISSPCSWPGGWMLRTRRSWPRSLRLPRASRLSPAAPRPTSAPTTSADRPMRPASSARPASSCWCTPTTCWQGTASRSLPRPGFAAGYSRTSTPIWPRRGTPGRARCARTASQSARQARRTRRTRLISSAGHWWPSTGCGTYGSSSRRISSSLSCSSAAASASCR